MELFGVYIKFLRGGNGNLSTLWLSYMDMTDILLGLIRASKEGDWMLHMASVRATIPWCVAYDRLYYARFLPCYCAHMSQLPTPHPDVHAEFMQGGFSVQLSSNNPFGRIHVDHTIEETVNKMNTMGQGISKPHLPDLQDTRIRKDEADIKCLIVLLENNWLNPYLSMGQTSLAYPLAPWPHPLAVVNDLLRSFEVGEEAYQTFKHT